MKEKELGLVLDDMYKLDEADSWEFFKMRTSYQART